MVSITEMLLESFSFISDLFNKPFFIDFQAVAFNMEERIGENIITLEQLRVDSSIQFLFKSTVKFLSGPIMIGAARSAENFPLLRVSH